MNNLFKIRKINKMLNIFSDSFLGFDQDLIDFYEKELQNNDKLKIKVLNLE
jgi:hypothetical protein